MFQTTLCHGAASLAGTLCTREVYTANAFASRRHPSQHSRVGTVDSAHHSVHAVNDRRGSLQVNGVHELGAVKVGCVAMVRDNETDEYVRYNLSTL